MYNQVVSKSSKALEGLCGVRVVPDSPFNTEEFVKDEELQHKNCKKTLPKIISNNHYFNIQKLWNERPACFRPIHNCDIGEKSVAESTANVLTSLPFIALGLLAPRKNQNCKLYANSLIGVGIASSLYHASRGSIRKYLRWADYTMIAIATTCLSRAIKNENPKLLVATTSAFLLPIQPIVVSAFNTVMLEVYFAKRASKDPKLKKAHNMHKMSSVMAGAMFVGADVFPETSYIHAGWHLAAAAALATFNKLLE